jgi:hypothetical protein
MKTYHIRRNLQYRFDFEIGYLKKSPCKECEERDDFPKCIDTCRIIDQIHDILTESISCTKG